MRKKLPRSNASSRSLPPGRPVTASHSGPFSRSRMAVRSRKSQTAAGWRLQHVLRQIVHDVAVVTGEGPARPVGLIARFAIQTGDAKTSSSSLEPGNPSPIGMESGSLAKHAHWKSRHQQCASYVMRWRMDALA